MILMTLAEIADAVHGELSGGTPDTLVTGSVEFDSRKVTSGSLFVAFVGALVDGHDFADKALADGAVAVLGSRPVENVPTIVVGDPRTALGQLARAVLDRLPGLTVVGITGSSGKTSTKDLVGELLARLGPTVAPPGSFNNELGLPYTVLRADPATRFLVLEMGSRGPGHLRYLCEIAPPRIGVVVNVGFAHIGEFGSVDVIAKAKAELVEALPGGGPAGGDGVAVLNADDDRVRAMAAGTAARVVLVGEAPDAALRAVDVTLDDRGRASYTLKSGTTTAAVTLGLVGRHQVGNSLLAAAVAIEAGASLPDVAAALGDLRPVSTRRMDVFDRADGVTVIDDSYNANPASTAVALRALVAMGSGRRTIAVLGYLAELGRYERDGHEEVGRLAVTLGVDRLVVVGEAAAPMHDGAVSAVRDGAADAGVDAGATSWGGESVRVTDQGAAIALLGEILRPGDVVLVKGSRYRTWDVADWLRTDVAHVDAARADAARAEAARVQAARVGDPA